MKTKIKYNKVLISFCGTYIALFIVGGILSAIYPIAAGDGDLFRNFPFHFLFFTRQTGILGLVYVIFILINKSKKANSVLGCIINADFFIVNIIAGIGINSLVGGHANPILLVIDIINHLVLFALVLIIFLITISPDFYRHYCTKLSKKDILMFFGIPITVFFIPAAIVNFIKLPPEYYPETNNYFTPYGALTNFNPDAGGHYGMLTMYIPTVGIFLLTSLSCKYISNLCAVVKKEDVASQVKLMLKISILLNALIANFFIFIMAKIILYNPFRYISLEIVNMALTSIILGYSTFLLFNSKNKIISFKGVLILLIIVFAFIAFAGSILQVTVNDTAQLQSIATTCFLYLIFTLAFTIILIIYEYKRILRNCKKV